MSVWADIHRRSNGQAVRKEDQLEDIKKKIKIAAKEYVEDYIEAMFESEYSAQEIKDHYEWAFMDDNSEYVVQRMENEDQDKFWELEEEHNLCDYTYTVLKHLADEMISALEDDEEEE